MNGPLSREEWQMHYNSQHPNFSVLREKNKLVPTMKELQQRITLYASVLAAISRSEHDALFDARSQIADLMVEQQKHEQDVVNWSKILQHLNASNVFFTILVFAISYTFAMIIVVIITTSTHYQFPFFRSVFYHIMSQTRIISTAP